ncbi:hypothetical protein A2V49_03845 [candidate division WWE3 bacterium RBG_19FT_COMBO_34_6]|uniref:Uncharacterized protein n=1 Tax=candidate division WWE3 bacterium RBG_19FT_COMBO_34_6 TaxID=1802612 RepID=A0A1F4UKU1_UNCKA|nr:MAG: hypothetical protein A2V49_03845 [candidate division WWE3 bacterium RBG_19FT_COMBO_34_6]
MLNTKKLLNNDIFIFIFSFVLTFITYICLLRAGFLSLDDTLGVVENYTIRSIKDSIRSLYIIPITSSILYKLFGLSAWVFHLRGIFLHSVNVFLLYLIAKKLIGQKTALLTLFFFIFHPGVSEPISWISGHVYLFASMFNLLTILFYIKFQKDKKNLFFVVSIIFYILYIIFNRGPWVILTPVLVYLIDILFLGKKFILDKKILFLIPLIMYLIIFFPDQVSSRTDAIGSYFSGTTAPNKFITIGQNIGRSYTLLIFPINLNITFSHFEPNFINFASIFINYILLILIFYYSYKKDRIIFGLLCVIYASTLPLFSPFNIAVNQAERYFYLAVAFYCILISYLLVNIVGKKISNKYIFIFYIICTLFFIRTFVRTLDWKNDESLWASAERTVTNNYNVYNEMGNVYFAKNDMTTAFKYYQKALDLRPKYPTSLHNIGLINLKLGKIEDAKKLFESAVEIDPTFYDSYYRLGQVAKFEGDIKLAKEYFDKALIYKKDFEEVKKELQKL